MLHPPPPASPADARFGSSRDELKEHLRGRQVATRDTSIFFCKISLFIAKRSAKRRIKHRGNVSCRNWRPSVKNSGESELKKKQRSKINGQVIMATFSCNLSRNNVALQVAIVCCPYYHLRAQQIFLLQEIDALSTFARGGGNTATNNRNFQCNIVARQVARKMLPLLLGLKAL